MYDKIIIGAGLYGLYSAAYCGKKGEKILVLEYENGAFGRATYINQARVHKGYHYPRSYSTAIKSAKYFKRFEKDYAFCIHKDFKQIYATSKKFSWTDAKQFKKFCDVTSIKCEEEVCSNYFKNEMCDGAFLTDEYTFDSDILKKHLLLEVEQMKNIEIIYNVRIKDIQKSDQFIITTNDNVYYTKYLLNATYASVNQIINLLGFQPFNIKYELCEIILCKVNDQLKNKGITVMDGPFFSIMPFGKTGLHSLTSVTFTPHLTSLNSLPIFECQKRSNGFCSPKQLGNCNNCPAKPESAWQYMSNMAKKYLKDEFEFTYYGSLFSMKPILLASEIDDSRPTVIKVFSNNPTFVSVLSGKINTVYDLEEVLDNDK
ncbi:MAG: FAD-dependent oxidoreductase [Bacilli bacterium]